MLSSARKRHLSSWFSIRTQLLILLVAIAGFLIGDRVQEMAAEREREIAAATRDVLRNAQSGARREAEIIASTRALLVLAAGDPNVTLHSPTSCRATFRAVTAILAWVDAMSLYDTAGRQVCTSSTLRNTRGVADRPYFRAALDSRSFTTSDFLTSRLTSRPILAAALPRLVDGEIHSVLLASISADWFTRIARASSGLETADVMLVNSAGEVVSTSTRLTRWVGRNLKDKPDLWEALHQPDGVIGTAALEGVERIVAHIRLPVTKGFLLVMRSRGEVLSQWSQNARGAFTKILVIGVVGLLLVWFGGQRFVLQPLQALGSAAKRFGEGNLSVRVETRKLAPELATLGHAFNAMSALLARREDELKRANARLAELAATDGLTGIANKRRFDEQLDTEWRRALRTGTPLSLIVMDVDHFKKFNDRYGHVAGDDCLQRVAEVLRRACRRPGDVAARIGGEEFAILLPGAQIEDGVAIAESIRLAVSSLRIEHADSATGYVTSSLGVASHAPRANQSAVLLLNAADAALYKAKHSGRNRVTVHVPPVALAS